MKKTGTLPSHQEGPTNEAPSWYKKLLEKKK